MSDQVPIDNKGVIQTLGQDARRLIRARMLPMSQLTEEDITRVRKDYLAYTEQCGIFNSVVAKKIGVSDSVISQFCHAQYAGDNDAVARKLNNWIEQDARKRRTEIKPTFVNTVVAQEMRDIIQFASTECLIASIVAPAGCGKTLLLEYMSKKLNGHYLRCTEDMKPRAFMAAIAKVLKLSTYNGTTAALFTEICARLKGTDQPLFFDEAQDLPEACYSRIRAIYDVAKVPIILAGTDKILVRIDDRANGRGQFASRCIPYVIAEHFDSAENPDGGGTRAGRSLFTIEEVAKFLEQQNVRLSDDALQMAWAVACLENRGCLRLVRQIVRMARPQADGAKTEITLKEFKRNCNFLLGIQGAYIVRCAENYIEYEKRTA